MSKLKCPLSVERRSADTKEKPTSVVCSYFTPPEVDASIIDATRKMDGSALKERAKWLADHAITKWWRIDYSLTERVEFTKELGEIGDPAAIPSLAEIIREREKKPIQSYNCSDYYENRLKQYSIDAAYAAIAKIGGEEAQATLVELIKAEDNVWRHSAIEALALTKAPVVVAALVAIRKEGTEHTRYLDSQTFANAFAKIGTPEAIQTLFEMLESDSFGEASAASWSIRRMVESTRLSEDQNSQFLKLLVGELDRREKDPVKDSSVRMNIIQALGFINNQAAHSALIEIWNNSKKIGFNTNNSCPNTLVEIAEVDKEIARLAAEPNFWITVASKINERIRLVEESKRCSPGSGPRTEFNRG